MAATLALALFVIVMTGSGGASQAAAATITDVAWWSSSPAATAPEKGIAVSSGPSGAITVAAIRVLIVADSLDTATLVLKEEGGVQASGAQLQVCPTPNAWSAGPKQAMDKAPKPECDRAKAALARGADGMWRADVRTLLIPPSDDQDEVSLMVVPAGTGAVPLGFEVRFQPPALEATGTSAATPASGSSSGSFSESDFASSPGPSSSSDSFSTPSEPFTSSRFADSSPLPSLSSAQTSGTFESAPTAADTAAAEVAAPAAPVAGTARPVRRAAPTAEGPRGSRVGQALFFIALSTVVGVGVGFGHARLRPDGGGLPA